MAVGDPEKGVAPKHLEIPPVIVDMDGGYGNIFNVQRTTELYVNAGVAAAHIEDQVLPKRCGHIGGKALIPVNEMVGKLRMARAVADDLGNNDFVIIARTDGLSAVDAPESARGMELAIERGLRYLDTGIPDLLWCEFPTADREPVETSPARSASASRRRSFAFNWSSLVQVVQRPEPDHLRRAGRAWASSSSSSPWAASTPMGYGLSKLLQDMAERPGAGLHRAAAQGIGRGHRLSHQEPPLLLRRALPPPGRQDVRRRPPGHRVLRGFAGG